jgi:hypothetical protein
MEVSRMRKIMYTAVVLALVAAVFYFLTGFGLIHPGNLGSGKGFILFIIGGFYVLGAFLLLLRKRWLWLVGLVANSIAIIVFYFFYYQRPDVMFSAPGLGTKIPQIILEADLVYLIVKHGK